MSGSQRKSQGILSTWSPPYLVGSHRSFSSTHSYKYSADLSTPVDILGENSSLTRPGHSLRPTHLGTFWTFGPTFSWEMKNNGFFQNMRIFLLNLFFSPNTSQWFMVDCFFDIWLRYKILACYTRGSLIDSFLQLINLSLNSENSTKPM